MEISFIFILLLNLIYLSKSENIYNFQEKNIILTKSDFFKVYKFFPKTTINLEQEIILQIKSTNNYENGKINICSGFFHNINEENIYYDYSKNKFINCQKYFSIQISNYIEINIENSSYITNITNNGYYFIVPYVDRQNGLEFSGVIMPFITNTEIGLRPDEIPKYFYFTNNYNVKNFSFLIPYDRLQQKNLHIQIALLNSDNKFNINVFNDKEISIDNKNSIDSYNNFIVFNNSENNYYVNISFLKGNSEIENKDFAIYFEYSFFNNNITKLSKNIYDITFLTKSDFYFAQNLSNQNDNLFYILNDFFGKKGSITLSWAKINLDNLTIDKISSINFFNCRKRHYMDNLTIFNYQNENLLDTSNILILKLSGSGSPSLKLHRIQFKILPKIIIEKENEFSHYSFNSESIIENFGYFYIPKTNNETKHQLLYCSKSDTMNIFRGDYDILDAHFLDNLISGDLRLFKVDHQKEIISDDGNNGFTIITYNKEDNYFVQIFDVPIDIYNNLLIEKITNPIYLNRELEFNTKIQSYYIFRINDYSSEISDLILDFQIIYGNLSAEYIDIDSIKESDFHLNKILLFENGANSIINAKHPILIKKTTELIKITNYNYNDKYLFKAKFYLNEYFNILENKLYNSLIPIYLKPLESKKFLFFDKNSENTQYMFKLGDNYSDCVKDSNDNLLQIILWNNNINHKFNISNENNIIKKNNSYIYFGDSIHFTNYLDKPILIWCFFGNQENDIVSINLSKNYYYLYRFSVAHKLSFDWYNIRAKTENGLIPQKIEISILNEKNNKAMGYYYQKLVFFDDYEEDYLYLYSGINSINYELDEGQSHIFLREDINITEYDYHYYGESLVNFLIFPESGLLTALFYIEYLYDISEYENKLKFLQFDNSIYSLNLKPNITLLQNMNHNHNNKNYLFFQILSGGQRDFQKELNISFKINSNSNANVKLNKENNSLIKTISYLNIIGYINIENFVKEDFNEDLYINILKPNLFFIRYEYLSLLNLDQEFSFKNNYNINIEKEQNSGGISFVVSFDCFLSNIKSNYTILIVNKTEFKNMILSEYDFFAFLENQNNSKNYKYINFIDNNLNERIKKEIYFEEIGNYEIFVMAHALETFPIYKYLGSETYSYIYRFEDRTVDEEETSGGSMNTALLIVIILLSLFILLIIIFIIFYFKKKRRLINLLNNKKEELLLSKINKTENEFYNEYELATILNNSNDYIKNKSQERIDKPINDADDSNMIIGNDFNKDLENNSSGEPPAPIIYNTFCSEEDRMKFELNKLKYSPNNKNNENGEDKKYFNTNSGE